MTFTITDFLISLPITAIIIFAIKLVYKRAGRKNMSIRMTQEEIWLSIWSNIRQTAKMRIIRQ